MPTLSPIATRVNLARSLFRDIVNENDLFYVFFGRTQKWNDGTEVAPTPDDTRDVLSDVRRNLLAAKRLTEADVVYLVRRIDWTTGTTYDRFDNTIDMEDVDFYVYNTTNYCIYKCLNRLDYMDGSSPVPSTSQPSDTSPEKFSTADGYWWKLVYYIPEADRLKFLSSEYLPVRFFSSSTSFNCSGFVNTIELDSVGIGYTTPPVVVIRGDGKGAAAVCDINTSGGVNSVTVITGGSGYSYATAEFVGGDGSGATAVVTLVPQDIDIGLNEDIAAYAQATGGQVEFIDVVDIGQNYQPDTIFKILGDGVDATIGTVTLEEGGGGEISNIVVSSGGRNYTSATMQTIGDGEFGTFRFLLSPSYGYGGNVPLELRATTLGIVVNVQDFLGDFFLENDFRQVGLIKNLLSYNTPKTIFTEQTCDASYVVSVSNPTDYHVDDLVDSSDGGVFRVVSVVGANVKLQPIYDIITENSVLYNSTTSAELGHFISIVSYPEFDYRSGDLLYLNNMLPVSRSASQTETIKIFLSF